MFRSIETGMNETRTSIPVLGDSSDEGSLKPSLAQLGNARLSGVVPILARPVRVLASSVWSVEF